MDSFLSFGSPGTFTNRYAPLMSQTLPAILELAPNKQQQKQYEGLKDKINWKTLNECNRYAKKQQPSNIPNNKYLYDKSFPIEN